MTKIEKLDLVVLPLQRIDDGMGNRGDEVFIESDENGEELCLACPSVNQRIEMTATEAINLALIIFHGMANGRLGLSLSDKLEADDDE